MNVGGRYRYAHKDAHKEFDAWESAFRLAARIKRGCGDAAPELAAADPLDYMGRPMKPEHRSRHVGLRPGGPIAARFIAPQRLILQLGHSVYVHAGLLPHHLVSSRGAEGGGGARGAIAATNARCRRWMEGGLSAQEAAAAAKGGPRFVQGRQSMVWTRLYSKIEEDCDRDCSTLAATLRTLSAAPVASALSVSPPDVSELVKLVDTSVVRRMVVGHTIQVRTMLLLLLMLLSLLLLLMLLARVAVSALTLYCSC